MPAVVKAAPEAFTFFRRHLLPTTPRMMPRMAPRTTAVRTQAADEEPGEHQQPQCFPVAEHRALEERGYEPVPQAHHSDAHDTDHHDEEHQNPHSSRDPESPSHDTLLN